MDRATETNIEHCVSHTVMRKKPDPNCEKCNGSGVKAHMVDADTGHTTRIKCECIKEREAK